MVVWVVHASIVVLFALACGLLVLAYQRGRLGLASLVLLGAAVAVWAYELVALATGTGAGDGFATCTDDCGASDYVSAVAFVAPPLLMALAAFAMLVTVARRIRVRRAGARELAS